MEPKTFIFIGRSGCGKGTQVDLVKKYLAENDSARELYHMETGNRFREFIKGDGYASKRTRQIVEAGKRVHSFVAIWLWSSGFIENMREDKHLVVDGSPRTKNEAEILHTVMEFFNRSKPCIIYMDVSREWAIDRLTGRGRSDDSDVKKVNEKQDFFENDVLPAIRWYEQNDFYHFVRINGEQSIEGVHADIMKAVF